MAMAVMVHLLVIHLSATSELLEEAAFLFRPEMWIITPLLLLLSDAFSYPFYFRFGFVKGAIIYGFVLISLMILTVITIRFWIPEELGQQIVGWISGLQPWLAYAGLIAIICLIQGSSVLVSIEFYKRQDL